MRSRHDSTGGNWLFNTVLIIMSILVVAAIVFPFLAPHGQPSRKSDCQSNMKELGTAVALYHGDYDGNMPSSFFYGRSKTWSPESFVKFASERGAFPPTGAYLETASWPELFYPYMKNKDIIWCPSDPGQEDKPQARVSYYLKAAIDRAWYGDEKVKCRKEADFDFPSDQIIFYEHNGWHWGDTSKGLTDGVTINCMFMDGHVASKRITNSGYTTAENPPEPLPKSGVGEPAWFNAKFSADKLGNTTPSQTAKGAFWNPHEWGDNLP